MKKFKKKAEGVISLMLAFLMLPFISVAGVVVESARYYSASSLLSQAMDSASYSTLANYDSYLLDRFGLLGMSQKNDVQKTFSKYMDANLKTLSENGFSGFTSKAEGIYPLSDPSILRYQVDEMDKILSPATLAVDSLNLKDLIKDLEKSMGVTKVLNIAVGTEKLFGNMADSVSDLEDMVPICKDLKKMNDETYKQAFGAFLKAMADYKKASENYENAKSAADDAKSAADDANQKLDDANQKLDDAKKELEKVEGDDKVSDDEETLVDENKNVTDAKNAQEEAENAAEEAKNAAEESKNALDEAKKAAEEAQNALSEARIAAKNARKNYSEVLTSYAALLQKYKDKKQDYKDHVTTLENSLLDVVKEGKSWYYDSEFEKDTKVKELDEKSEEYRDLEYENDRKKTIVDKTVKGLKSMNTNLNDSVKDHLDDNMDPYIQAMQKMAEKVDALDLDGDDVPEIAKDEYKVDRPTTIDADKIQQAMIAENLKANESGIFDLFKAVVEVYNTVVHFKGVVDSDLNAVVNTDYYSTNAGGLSSLNLEPAKVNQEDRAKALEINKKINEATGTKESGTASGGTTDSIIMQLMQHITEMSDIMQKMAKPEASLLDRLKSAMEMAGEFGKIAVDVVKFRMQSEAAMLQETWDNAMFYQYLVGMLPCRTDYASGKAMNGYGFSKIAFAVQGTFPVVPFGILAGMAGSVAREKSGTDTMFCGAELEYILGGSSNEIDNQLAAARAIYLERLILDIVPVLTDDVMSKALEVAPWGWILVLFVIVAEPLLDLILLVSGADVTLIKSQIYISPKGIRSFGESALEIKNSKNMQYLQQMQTELADAEGNLINADVKVDEYTKPAKTSYAQGLLKLSYKQHLLLAFLILRDNETYARRLADLIEMETESYNIKNNTGVHFNLNKSYTFVRSEASGSLNQMLPIPTLSNNSLLSTSVLQYRGY